MSACWLAREPRVSLFLQDPAISRIRLQEFFPLLFFFFNFLLHLERADVEGCVDGRQVPEPRGVYEGRGMVT